MSERLREAGGSAGGGAPPPPLPAGDFAAWLAATLDTLERDAPADVPCASCNACCRTRHFIHVRPEERRARARLPREFLSPAPGLPPGNLVLGFDEHGRCPRLVDGRCTIYAERPIACRTYDCRVYAATGVAPDRDEIARQVRRWRFAYPVAADRRLQDAVTAAAGFVREHPECVPGDAARVQPIRVAVLALAVHELLLDRGGRPGNAGGDGVRRRSSSEAEIVRAAAAANERLFGDG